VGSAGHVVHSGVSGMGNTGALFFMLRWDRYGFHKKCSWTYYAELVFLHPVKSADNVVDYSASGVRNLVTLFFMLGVGPVWIPQKARRDTLHQTCAFASAGICGSQSAFQCVWGVKRRRTIFCARVGLVRIP
jgi:hypothetical protein